MARVQDLKVNKITKAKYDQLVSNGTITKDMINNQLWIFTDSQFVSSQNVKDWNAKANASDIPTKLSQLNNDGGFITSASIPTKVSQLTNDANYATKSQIPTKTSQLTNDSNLASKSDIPTHTSQLTNDSNLAYATDIPTRISQLTDDSTFADVSELPTKTSQLTNDSGFLTDFAEKDPTVPSWAKELQKPTYTKNEVGLGNVDNKSSETIRSEITSSNVTSALGFTPVNPTALGTTIATLGSDGKVPTSQLPSYVDDVLEFANRNAFPSTGESGKIYVAMDTNKTYRWSGTTYIPISTDLALGETSATAYPGDRGKFAYDHANSQHAPAKAQENVIEQINVNGVKVTPVNKVADITVPTKMSELTNDVGFEVGGSIPTKLSDLSNDVGFITSASIPENVSAFNNDKGYTTAADLPTKLSELTNDSGFITSSAVPTKTSQLNNDSGFVTSVPTRTSQLTNDSGFITSAPTKTSQLTNDSNFVVDASYVHTDNNLTASRLSNLNENTNARHSHTNKSLLDTISQADIDKWNDKRAVGDTLPIGTIVEYPSDNIPEMWLLCNGQAVSRIEYPELFAAIGTTWGAGDGSTTFNLPSKEGLITFGKKSSDSNFSTIGMSGGALSHKHSNDSIASTSLTIADTTLSTDQTNLSATGSTVLTVDQMPQHDHWQRARTGDGNFNPIATVHTGGTAGGATDPDEGWFGWTNTGTGWLTTHWTGRSQGHTHPLGSHAHSIKAHTHTIADHTHTISATLDSTSLPPYVTSNYIIKAKNITPTIVDYATVAQDMTVPKESEVLSTLGLADLITKIRIETLKAENPVGHIRMETTNTNPADYLGFGTWVLWGSGQVPVGVNTSDTDFSTVEKSGGAKTVNLSHTHSSAAHTHSVNSHTHSSAAHTHSTSAHRLTVDQIPSHTHQVYGYPEPGGNLYGLTSVYQGSGSRSTGVGNQIYLGEARGGGGDGTHSHGNTGSTTPGATGGTSLTTNSTTPGATGSALSSSSVVQPYITCYMWKRTA